MWQPGDRVFLFGFSRGAYTVRCLAAVLSFCGIPTTMADGKTPLFRDVNSTRKIAKEAVKKVYTYVGSPKDTAYLEQRRALALRFREKYGSDINGGPNVNPFFVGVFDTVASLGSYRVGALAVGGFLAALALVSLVQSFFLFAFWPTFVALIAISIIAAGVWYSFEHVQYAIGLDGYSFWQTLHLTSWKMQFYDKHLDNAVWYARHALSIDENRADFARVFEWGSSKNTGPPRPDSYPDWLEQIWFAGVHSDIRRQLRRKQVATLGHYAGVDDPRCGKFARCEHSKRQWHQGRQKLLATKAGPTWPAARCPRAGMVRRKIKMV